jgi:hypothetical protein
MRRYMISIVSLMSCGLLTMNNTDSISKSSTVVSVLCVFACCRVNFILALITSESMLDSELLQQQLGSGQCPVCLKKCGHRAPRSAMMNHIRRSADPQHVVWRAKHWSNCFPHGKYRCKQPNTRQLLAVIEKEYGIDVLDLIATELTLTRHNIAH